MTMLEDLVRRVERLEADAELHDLAQRYCIGADQRDLELWISVWTPDAVWETGPEAERTLNGIAAISAAVQAQWDALPIMQHATTNHRVVVTGDTATGHSDVVVMVQLGEQVRADAGKWILGGGTYADEYRRTDDGWRISRRTVVRPFDLAPLAPSRGPIELDD